MEGKNESHFISDSTNIRGIIYFLLANDLFSIELFQSSVCDYLF